jgi:hypothetical protein
MFIIFSFLGLLHFQTQYRAWFFIHRVESRKRSKPQTSAREHGAKDRFQVDGPDTYPIDWRRIEWEQKTIIVAKDANRKR